MTYFDMGSRNFEGNVRRWMILFNTVGGGGGLTRSKIFVRVMAVAV